MNQNNSSSASESEDIDFDLMFPDKKSIEIYVNGNNSLDLVDAQEYTLLMHVCLLEYSDIALNMLSKGPYAVKLANVNGNGQTALVFACISKLKQVIIKMLDFGPEAVNINSEDIGNDTPFMEVLKLVEEDSSFSEIAIQMLEFGPRNLDLSIVNSDDYTALMLACKYKLKEIILKMFDSYDGQTYDLNLFQENEEGETAYDIAFRNNLEEESEIIRSEMREEEQYHIDIPSESIGIVPVPKIYASGTIPSLSLKDMQIFQQNKSLSIDLQLDGWDPFLMDNENILTYLKEDLKDNIAIKYFGKVYLSKRSILQMQKEDATVFECLETNKKVETNIVYNLPLFNIKKIGINISSDNAVGIEPEYIYMDGINNIINNSSSSDILQNIFGIIPIPDKMLLSVISLEEVNNVGSRFTEASSLHCQAGQNGLAGFIVQASETTLLKGGKGFIKKKKFSKKKSVLKKKKFSKNNTCKNKTKLRKRK
jgi:hypothetical protein